MKQSLRQAGLRLAAPTKRNTFICLQCRAAHPQLFSTTRYRSAPETPSESGASKPDFSQRLRRRIWGTDNPPGQKDPYRTMSAEEKAAEQAELEEIGRDQDLSQETAGEVSRRLDSGEYRPAITWDGLETIGGPSGWWEEAWDRDNVFSGFLTKGPLQGGSLGGEDVTSLARRVAVEIMALQQLGVSLQAGAKAEWTSEEFMEDIDIVRGEDGVFALREQAPDLIEELVEILQHKDPENEVEVDGAAGEDSDEQRAAEKRLLEELHAEEDAAAAELVGPEEGTAEIETVGTTKIHDPLYLEIPLTDLDFKFAFIKRLTYLTGMRIPDPRIGAFNTLGDVVEYLSEKPKPKKLAEMLMSMPELKALPNVEVRDSRRSFVDKEMEIGRWKVIEAELRSRGLPVRKSERLMK